MYLSCPICGLYKPLYVTWVLSQRHWFQVITVNHVCTYIWCKTGWRVSIAMTLAARCNPITCNMFCLMLLRVLPMVNMHRLQFNVLHCDLLPIVEPISVWTISHALLQMNASYGIMKNVIQWIKRNCLVKSYLNSGAKYKKPMCILYWIYSESLEEQPRLHCRAALSLRGGAEVTADGTLGVQKHLSHASEERVDYLIQLDGLGPVILWINQMGFLWKWVTVAEFKDNKLAQKYHQAQ